MNRVPDDMQFPRDELSRLKFLEARRYLERLPRYRHFPCRTLDDVPARVEALDRSQVQQEGMEFCTCRPNAAVVSQRNETVEKLIRERFAEIGSRQEALQTIFSALIDIFHLPIFRFPSGEPTFSTASNAFDPPRHPRVPAGGLTPCGQWCSISTARSARPYVRAEEGRGHDP